MISFTILLNMHFIQLTQESFTIDPNILGMLVHKIFAQLAKEICFSNEISFYLLPETKSMGFASPSVMVSRHTWN
jgi:hypothetical protein